MASNAERINSNAASSTGPQGDEIKLLTASNGIKIILLGDSAVGKSKLVERFLQSSYKPHLLSTYALTLYKHIYKADDGTQLPVDIWDTAGQERFNSMHASYYYRAHVRHSGDACIMVFDVTRKLTYKNLDTWYEELQRHAPGIPTLVVANKIDVDYQVTQKSFKFAEKHGCPFFFVSASDGTNVVRIFNEAILQGIKWKLSPKEDLLLEALDLLAGLDSQAKQQQSQLIKAVLGTADAEAAEQRQQARQQ
ncbi:small rab-related GTPase [Scenedesmus sp. NREL 46B-D3]|nr:small rab-related GTPase [Scenedesmus sp. NREL 46B-D3]